MLPILTTVILCSLVLGLKQEVLYTILAVLFCPQASLDRTVATAMAKKKGGKAPKGRAKQKQKAQKSPAGPSWQKNFVRGADFGDDGP